MKIQITVLALLLAQISARPQAPTSQQPGQSIGAQQPGQYQQQPGQQLGQQPGQQLSQQPGQQLGQPGQLQSGQYQQQPGQQLGQQPGQQQPGQYQQQSGRHLGHHHGQHDQQQGRQYEEGGQNQYFPSGNVTIINQTDENKGDGTFSFSYETSDGTKFSEEGYIKKSDGNQQPQQNPETGEYNTESSGDIQVIQGEYSYTAPDGQVINIQFIADENGFQPKGEHLPTLPENLGQENQEQQLGNQEQGYDQGRSNSQQRQRGRNYQQNAQLSSQQQQTNFEQQGGQNLQNPTLGTAQNGPTSQNL